VAYIWETKQIFLMVTIRGHRCRSKFETSRVRHMHAQCSERPHSTPNGQIHKRQTDMSVVSVYLFVRQSLTQEPVSNVFRG